MCVFTLAFSVRPIPHPPHVVSRGDEDGGRFRTQPTPVDSSQLLAPPPPHRLTFVTLPQSQQRDAHAGTVGDPGPRPPPLQGRYPCDQDPLEYRGTSSIRNRAPVGPYSRAMPRALWWSWGGGSRSDCALFSLPASVALLTPGFERLGWLLCGQHSSLCEPSSPAPPPPCSPFRLREAWRLVVRGSHNNNGLVVTSVGCCLGSPPGRDI